MANKSEGIPQQRPAWDTPPEGDPRLAARGRPRLGPIDPMLMRQVAQGAVGMPTPVAGGQAIWQQGRREQPMRPMPKKTPNPFISGAGY